MLPRRLAPQGWEVKYGYSRLGPCLCSGLRCWAGLYPIAIWMHYFGVNNLKQSWMESNPTRPSCKHTGERSVLFFALVCSLWYQGVNWCWMLVPTGRFKYAYPISTERAWSGQSGVTVRQLGRRGLSALPISKRNHRRIKNDGVIEQGLTNDKNTSL